MTGDRMRGESVDDPMTVVSAVILRRMAGRGTLERGSPDCEVLLGVRRPSPLARRHPGVLSTPTTGVAPDLFEALVHPFAVPRRVPGVYSVDGAPLLVGHGGHIQTVDAFVLDGLLARKAGLSGALVQDRFEAVAAARFVALDEVKDPLGTAEAQWTLMITYEVHVVRGAGEFPPATESYSRLLWAPADRLPRAVAARDALLFDDSLDPFQVCIDGLCTRLAATLLSA